MIFDDAEPRWMRGFASRPFASALSCVVLLWCSYPPVANLGVTAIDDAWMGVPWLSLLAWVALLPLLPLIVIRKLQPGTLRKIWLAAWLYWAATLYFIPIPHWAMWFGWLALSSYMSIYLPLFVIAARVLIQRFKLPILLAAAISWVGLEYFRTYCFTGFGLALLGHTQVKFPFLIQIADLGGAYAVSFLIVFVATCLFLCLRRSDLRSRLSYSIIGVLAIVASLVYGTYRLSEQVGRNAGERRSVRVGVLQGNIDTVFPKTPEEAEQNFLHKVHHYRDLASSAKLWQEHHDSPQAKANVDLLIWPEGKFSVTDFFVNVPHDRNLDSQKINLLRRSKEAIRIAMLWMQSVGVFPDDPSDHPTNPYAIPSLVGAQTVDPLTNDIFNSVLLIDSAGEVVARYYKNHRVLIGEYIPLENQFPFLRQLTPQGKGLTPGTLPAAIQFNGFVFCPNICFESCVPHLLRRQVNQLEFQEGLAPDFMVNLTDDGWFYGSSCLDLHLACTIFRAVELRKPTIVAANTGFSAHIDGSGVLQSIGPRREAKVLIVEASPDGRYSPYRIIGDWPVAGAAVLVILALVYEMKRQYLGYRNRGNDAKQSPVGEVP
ncbi:MAG TPA: apolipoprotein N-acyltransferase [Pirellulaceae bacterium]|nr:apolipoprotein N-acyltransferase [Pirellulaceae bacterium]HMO91065.1 apolipoprotein N-acyltransferase [Pirellulaceae bacterium]HMP68179.1 apolipoprotein N-acyltransferase [Pirellulaceae bacterium]